MMPSEDQIFRMEMRLYALLRELMDIQKELNAPASGEF